MKIVLILSFFFSVLFAELNEDLDEVYQFVRKGAISQARAIVLKNLEKTPKHAQSLLLAAKLSLNAEYFLKYYKDLANLPKKSIYQEEALYRLGQFYYSCDKYDQASRYFQSLVQKYPTGNWYVWGYYWGGYSYLNSRSLTSKRRLNLAEQYFTRLLVSTPSQNNYQSLALMGLVSVARQKNERRKVDELLDVALESPEHNFMSSLSLLVYENSGTRIKKRYYDILKEKYPKSFEFRWLRGSHTKKVLENLTAKSVDVKKGYILQFGVFSSFVNAENLVTKINNSRLKIRIVKKEAPKTLYFVRSKIFETRQQALRVARQELSSSKIPYYIRKK